MLLLLVLIYSMKNILEAVNTDLAKMHIFDILFIDYKTWNSDSTEFYIEVQMRYQAFS